MNFWLKVVKSEGVKFEIGRMEDAGYDLYSTIDGILPPLTKQNFPVGIKTAFPQGWVGLILDRGSMGNKGITRLAGVIDSGYRGEWQVILANLGREILQVESVLKNPKAKAIAQVVFVEYGKVPPEFCSELPNSERGEGWNGSTN